MSVDPNRWVAIPEDIESFIDALVTGDKRRSYGERVRGIERAAKLLYKKYHIKDRMVSMRNGPGHFQLRNRGAHRSGGAS